MDDRDAWHEARRATDVDRIRSLQLGEAVCVDWSFSEYLADLLCVSRSQLDTLRASPQLYIERYERRSLPSLEPTPAMELGTNVHMCALEPSEWVRRVAAQPPNRPTGSDGRRKKGTPERDAYDEWKAAIDYWSSNLTDDSIIASEDDVSRVEAMARAINSHGMARLLLGGGRTEQTIIWRHAGTGILVRIRVDSMKEISDGVWAVADLKTTADPTPRKFAASVASFGYHRQGALYHDGVQALLPGAEIHFTLIAVRSKAPYEVACYEIERADLALGRAQYEAALEDLVRRRETNDWLAPWQHGMSPIKLPRWAYNEEN